MDISTPPRQYAAAAELLWLPSAQPLSLPPSYMVNMKIFAYHFIILLFYFQVSKQPRDTLITYIQVDK